MQILIYIIVALVGYLCGSINSAIILCRMLGYPDPRTQGSGNPGATNVLRIAGKKFAAITLFGDCLKAFIPTIIVRFFYPDVPILWLVTGICAFLGHLYPIFFRFSGGKGIASSLGVLLAWHAPLALIVLAIWIAIFAYTRISSLAAIISAFCAPWLAFLMVHERMTPIAILGMVALLIYRHRENLDRLRTGNETRFTNKDKL